MPLINRINNSLNSKYQLLMPRVLVFLLVFFWVLFFFSKSGFSQEEFVVVSDQKSDSDYSDKDSKTLVKVSKKNSTSSKNKNENTASTKAKEESSQADSQAQSSKNIFDFSEDDVAGINVLMMAVHSNDVQGVRFFSKAGGVLINQKNIGGATALHIASREGNYEIAKILIEGGANVNAVDNEGWTPLMRANLNGHYQIVDLLITKGANASGLNNVGESVIMHATLANCDKCLNIMLEKLNFSKNFSTKLLKEQITDSFIISRNRENPVIQGLLESYLDRLIKVSPVISNEDFKQKMSQSDEQNLNRSKVIEELNSKDLSRKSVDNQGQKNAIVVADFIDQKENLKKKEKHQKANEIEEKFKLITSKDKNFQNNKKNASLPKLVYPKNSKEESVSSNSAIKYALKKTKEDNKDFMIISNKNYSSPNNSLQYSQSNEKLQKFIFRQSALENNQEQKPKFVLKTIDNYHLSNSNQINSDKQSGYVLTKNPSYNYTKQKEIKEQIKKVIENNQKQIVDNKNQSKKLDLNNDSPKITNNKTNDSKKNQESANQRIANNNQKTALIEPASKDNNNKNSQQNVSSKGNKSDSKSNAELKQNKLDSKDKIENDPKADSSKNSSQQLPTKKKKFIIGVVEENSDDISKENSVLKTNQSKVNKSNVNSKN